MKKMGGEQFCLFNIRYRYIIQKKIGKGSHGDLSKKGNE